MHFHGTTQYLTRPSAVGNWATVTGAETYSGVPGLTFGGWFSFDSVAGAGFQRIIAKDNAVNRSYSLYLLEATDTIKFEYFTGAALQSIESVVTVAAANVWHFLVGRFKPATDHTIIIDGTILTAGHANASIDDTAAPFEIGRLGNGSQFFEGTASLCFLCACVVPDAVLFSLYQQTRSMFGV